MKTDMAQDRPTWRLRRGVLSQRLATPTARLELCLKSAIRYLASHPGGGYTRGKVEEPPRPVANTMGSPSAIGVGPRHMSDCPQVTLS